MGTHKLPDFLHLLKSQRDSMLAHCFILGTSLEASITKNLFLKLSIARYLPKYFAVPVIFLTGVIACAKGLSMLLKSALYSAIVKVIKPYSADYWRSSMGICTMCRSSQGSDQLYLLYSTAMAVR